MSKEQIIANHGPRGPRLYTLCASVPLASSYSCHTPGPLSLGLCSSCFPFWDMLTQPSFFLPLIKCYSFFKAHFKCHFLQDVFPNPSPQGHISPSLSLSSTVFVCSKRALFYSCLCYILVIFPPTRTPIGKGTRACSSL